MQNEIAKCAVKKFACYTNFNRKSNLRECPPYSALNVYFIVDTEIVCYYGDRKICFASMVHSGIEPNIFSNNTGKHQFKPKAIPQ